MKTMPAGEFKARCLRVMEEVKKYRTPVVITKKGKPVAKLVPPDERKKDVFGCMADRFAVLGDVEKTGVFPPFEAWDVARGRDWLTRPERRSRRKPSGSRKRPR